MSYELGVMSYLALGPVLLIRYSPSSVTASPCHLPPCGWKARAKPSPCQGEGAPVLTLGRMRVTFVSEAETKGLGNSYLLTPTFTLEQSNTEIRKGVSK